MRKKTSLLLLVVFLLAGAGCLRKRPIQYNNDLAVANWYLADAGKAMTKALAPLKKGEPANPVLVRSAYSAMEKALQDAREVSYFPPPRLSGRGWRMHYAYHEFLDSQQKLLKNQFLTIVETVDPPPRDPPVFPLPPDQQWAIIKPLLDEIAAEEEKTLKPLQETQKAYAHIYDTNLVPMPVTKGN